MTAATVIDNTVCNRRSRQRRLLAVDAHGRNQRLQPQLPTPAADDYRLSGGDRGVDWAPAEQQYGP